MRFHTLFVVQNGLAHPQALGSDLQQLVVRQEFQALLQAHLHGGSEPQGIVGAGGTGVGQLLLLAHVHRHVLAAGAHADDHAAVDGDAGADEEGAPLLGVVQAVGDGLAGLEGVHGAFATALDIALKEEDLVEIKEELPQRGYIRRKGGTKKAKISSKPFHYLSSDGFHIYVGKNNFQNDELTFKFATGNDWWFHAKGIHGSHVVVKTEGKELPDRTFEEAGRLAAYYSKGREQEKVEIDYVQKKQVKKPGGGKPGFVVYYTNYSMVIDSNISQIRLCAD